MNGKQLDNAKNVTINSDGRLFLNGTRRLDPVADEETGLATFQVSSSSPHGGKETRFLHIEVLRHFGNHPEIAPGILEAEDVEFLNEDTIEKYHIKNLQLSESGRKKVYSNLDEEEESDVSTQDSGEAPGDEGLNAEAPEAAQSSQSESAADEGISNDESSISNEEVEDEESGVSTQDSGEAPGEDLPPPQSSPEGGSSTDTEDNDAEPEAPTEEVEEPQKVFKAVKAGRFYDVVDPATDESILEALTGEDKKLPGGKDGVKAFAAEHEIEVEF